MTRQREHSESADLQAIVTFWPTGRNVWTCDRKTHVFPANQHAVGMRSGTGEGISERRFHADRAQGVSSRTGVWSQTRSVVA